MTYANQFDYDHASAPELSDYQDSPLFAEFCEYVTIELLAGRDCASMDSQVMVADLELNQKGFQWALDVVSERLNEKQFLEYLE